MSHTNNTCKTFYVPVDKRSRKAMETYLSGHFRYDTMSSWNRSTSYACNMKVDRLGLDQETVLKLLDMIQVPEFYDELANEIGAFNQARNYLWQAGWNGRSGGYLVLYQGGRQFSQHRSYCTSCGQKNFSSVSDTGKRCGVCGKETRVDFIVNANLKMSIFAETKCNFSPVSTEVYTALIHQFTCRFEARQALIYQLVLGLTGENGKYNYSRAVHVYPLFFDITCSAKNYKIAPALTSKVTKAVAKDKTKNASSYRSFPLTEEARRIFQEAKAKEQENRRLFGRQYQENNYVFKWDNGKPYLPDYITAKFSSLLKQHDLPHIRLHELRHSCASLLINEGFGLKDVQEWMGHADIKMTANIYGHLDVARKQTMAEKLSGSLSGMC